MLRESGFGLKKKNTKEESMSKDKFQKKHRDSAYNITHCIHCGRKGFKDFNEVLNHVRRECKKRKL